jgi:uncharacterized protein (DUF1501 family)
MLRILGAPFTCCNGITRRSLLKAGVLGLGGMPLSEMLRQRSLAADTGKPARKTSVIFVELAGGPTQFETYDPKPDAPAEYRGPLSAVATNVTGIQFSELMVRQAQIMDKLAIVRSVTHASSSHSTSAHLTQTGYYLRDPQRRENDNPSFGTITARLRGANKHGLPPYVAIPRVMRFGGAAYLGKQFSPFNTEADPVSDKFAVGNLELARGLDLRRLDDRQGLRTALDNQRRVIDTQGQSNSVDQFTREANELVSSGLARQAFDIAAEPASLRDRYGRTSAGQCLLLARRLVEAGVTSVTVTVPGWDDHGSIKGSMERKGPAYDQGLAALVCDLHERSLEKDVLVVSMGEFGRTPRVNASAGRDHWGSLMSVLLAGGGLKVGQVVGSSNAKGEIPADHPYRPENILAMVYRHLGIDPGQTFNDFSGRPRYILEERKLVSELI